MNSIDLYFRMARGSQQEPAMEMTKWFDTNYHYIVPEFEPRMAFHLASRKVVDEFLEAQALGIQTRPVLLGPVSFILLGKILGEHLSHEKILLGILPIYRQVLGELARSGADWVQIDEPCLVLDLDDFKKQLYRVAYKELAGTSTSPRKMIATYFESLGPNLETAIDLPIDGLHVDLVRAPGQIGPVLKAIPRSMRLSLGLIDGRNIWRADLRRVLALLQTAIEGLGSERVEIAPSCSLLHVPVDADPEDQFDAELLSWMAFAKQKLQELSLLAQVDEDAPGVLQEIEGRDANVRARRASPRVHNAQVQKNMAAHDQNMLERESPYPVRAEKQAATLRLPLLPTTTIGSFPQTAQVRQMRASFRAGKLERGTYEQFLEQEIIRCLKFQEQTGIDVLVHGEFERNDMVEYFGEQLSGFAFSKNGWVQSYGSRCVKPPIIFGDVNRPGPMTVRWSSFAQAQTARPVKGMLTGPVTILHWSFVRDDQPKSETCRQIAFAMRAEVADLERAGIRIIQIDEPAIREGLPLRREGWPDYMNWAVDCFRLASSGVGDETQIHTHMCYSEFTDILDAIMRMDADVISIESSRSRMEILDSFRKVQYRNEVGPGVYDIHSPRVPSVEEIEAHLQSALKIIAPRQLWVNPDCGLKTRKWDEVEPGLRNLVHAATRVRNALKLSAATRLTLLQGRPQA